MNRCRAKVVLRINLEYWAKKFLSTPTRDGGSGFALSRVPDENFENQEQAGQWTCPQSYWPLKTWGPAKRRVLLCLDYDGTISQKVSKIQRARPAVARWFWRVLAAFFADAARPARVCDRERPAKVAKNRLAPKCFPRPRGLAVLFSHSTVLGLVRLFRGQPEENPCRARREIGTTIWQSPRKMPLMRTFRPGKDSRRGQALRSRHAATKPERNLTTHGLSKVRTGPPRNSYRRITQPPAFAMPSDSKLAAESLA